MAKVFVSYSRKDITFAKRLTAELQKCELDFWIDWEGIPPTVDWWKEIQKGIEEADVFLFLISPDSAKSRICGQEIDVAVKNGKRIIPIVVREIEWQDTPLQLGHLNYIFFSRDDDFETATKKLMNAIQTDYEWAATHRRLQVKALEWERENKESSFLLRGRDLQDAEFDLATNSSKDPHPTDLQREFVLESRRVTDRQRRITTGVSIAATIVLAALAIYGFYQADKAEKQAQIALAGQLAAQSADLRDKDFELSLLLGVEANKELTTLQSYEELIENIQSHPHLRAYLSGHTDAVFSVAFSPDGKMIASGSRDGTIILWSIQSKHRAGQTLQGHTDAVTSVVFSPDSKTLASGSRDNSIILWDVETVKPVGEPLKEHDDGITSIAFSPNGQLLASGSRDLRIILWDVKSRQPVEILPTQPDFILSVAFSPDSKTLASGNKDSTILLWDLETHQPVAEPLTGHTDYVTSVAFSPDGQILASSSKDKTILLWDVKTHKPVGQPLERHADDVASVAFSPDGKLLASGSRDRTIILWNSETHEPIENPFRGHFESRFSYVLTVAFSPDGKTLASGGTDTNVILWDIVVNDSMKRLLNEPMDGIRSLTFTADSETLIVATPNGAITFRDAATGKSSEIFTKTDLTNFALSPNGKTLVLSNDGETITFWDIATNKSIGQSLQGNPATVAFSPDADRVAFGTKDGKIVIWDVTAGKLIRQFPNEIADLMAFNPDSNILAVVNGTIVKLLNVTTGKIDHSLNGHTQQVTTIAFSPDGRTLVSGGYDRTLILWDVLTGNAKGRPREGHTESIRAIAFRPDGLFASGSCAKVDPNFQCIQGEILLWDPVDQQPIGAPFLGHTKGITALAFSPDGNTLASGSDDTTILLWNLDPMAWIFRSCQQANRNFTLSEWLQYFPNDLHRKTCDQFSLDEQIVGTNPSSPATQVVPPANTAVPNNLPATIMARAGETIQCIARRYNLNPEELLQRNAVADDLIYGEEPLYEGLVLTIPQSGNPYPGTRMLRPHPATYTVASAEETIHQIACRFGDIDPTSIAMLNSLNIDAELFPGQQLSIP